MANETFSVIFKHRVLLPLSDAYILHQEDISRDFWMCIGTIGNAVDFDFSFDVFFMKLHLSEMHKNNSFSRLEFFKKKYVSKQMLLTSKDGVAAKKQVCESASNRDNDI